MKPLHQNINRIYFICCVGRTGSNHLCQMLRSTEAMGWPSEYYNRAGSYDQFRRKWGNVEPDRFFPTLCRRTATPNGVVGIKVAMDAMKLCLATRPWWFDYLDVRYIHLQRQDTLRQAISLYRANGSGIWAGKNDLSRDPPFDANKIRDTQQRIAAVNGKWEQWFKASGIEPLKLWYEELSDRSALAVASHVGVRIDPGKIESKARIMRDDRTEEWLARLTE